MQRNPSYDDVASEVAAFLEERLRFAVADGIDESRIALDPGIGFGKTVEQNFELVRRLDVLTSLGRPVLVGFSRKSSLGRIVGDPTGDDRLGRRERRCCGRRLRARRDDPPRPRRARARRGAEGRSRGGVRMIVEVHGLELHGRHGVNDDERRDGQSFLFDVTLEIDEPKEDTIEATVDYRRVRDIVRDRQRRAELPAARDPRGSSRRRAHRSAADPEGARSGPKARHRLGRVDGVTCERP